MDTIILTVFIMAPVAMDTRDLLTQQRFSANPTPGELLDVVQAVSPPLRSFLERNTSPMVMQELMGTAQHIWPEHQRHYITKDNLRGLQPLLNQIMGQLQYLANNPSAGLSLQQYKASMPSESVRMAIAAIIVILSSIRFIDRDRSNIALYYHLGATTRQVKCIYLGYFLTLMLTATLVAFLVATLIIAIFNLTHQDLLSAQALLGFALPAPRTIWWYGLSPELCLSIVIALLLAPLCTLINFKPLSTSAPSPQSP